MEHPRLMLPSFSPHLRITEWTAVVGGLCTSAMNYAVVKELGVWLDYAETVYICFAWHTRPLNWDTAAGGLVMAL